MRPELVKGEPFENRRAGSGPTWSAIATFVIGAFSVLSLGLMIGLGFMVFDAREDLKIQEMRLIKVEKDYAVLKALTDEYRESQKEKP